MKDINTNLTIGLPDGRHISGATYELLERSNLNVIDYKDISKRRKYKTKLTLPSGKMCDIIIDKAKDLLYSLSLGEADLMITGSDYVDDFCQFYNTNLNSPLGISCKVFESAHIQLNHLGYFGTQLEFMVRKNSPYNNLDDLISNQEKIICYTEFPNIASHYLSQADSYKKRFSHHPPCIISNFSNTKGNPDAIIVYSHGATESKAARNNKNLILDLKLSGKTSAVNELKTLCKIGEPIFNLIYKTKRTAKNDEMVEFIEIIENTIKKYPDLYAVSPKF